MIGRAVIVFAATGAFACASGSPAHPTPPAADEIQVTSRSPRAAALVGEALSLDDGRPERAVGYLTEALVLDPDLALAHAALAAIGPEAAAAQHRTRAQVVGVRLPRAEQLWIAAMLSTDDQRGAALRAVAAAAPRDWRIQRDLGFHAMWADLDPPTARAAFERVAQLRPQSGDTLGFLALHYADEERWAEALTTARRHVALSPGRPEAQDTLAEVQLMAGELDAAEATFRAVLATTPSFAAAHDGLASVRFHRGDWDGAMRGLRDAAAAIAEPQVRCALLRSLLWAQVARNQLAEARASFATCSASDRPLAPARFAIELAVEREAWADALAATVEAAQRNADQATPDAFDARWIQGIRVVALARLGRLDEADAQLAVLAAMPMPRPWHAIPLRIATGHVAWARGDTDRAVAAFRDPRVVNHTSLYDPGRAAGRPSFDQLALAGRLLAAEALAAGGRIAEARAAVASIARSRRRGIGAVVVRRRAEALRDRLARHRP